jgi:hypothetical protein
MFGCFGLRRRLEHIEKQKEAEELIARFKVACPQNKLSWENARICWGLGKYTISDFRRLLPAAEAIFYRNRTEELEKILAEERSSSADTCRYFDRAIEACHKLEERVSDLARQRNELQQQVDDLKKQLEHKSKQKVSRK